MNDTVWVRVEGKGTFQNSTGVKEFAKAMMARGHQRFVFDLRGCPMMDTTFMGTLAGIALKVRGREGAGVGVVNLNERTRGLLSNLGLDQLLELQPEGQPGASSPVVGKALEVGMDDRRTCAKTMLEAHQAVVDANPLNEGKFKDVLEYLRQDLEAQS